MVRPSVLHYRSHFRLCPPPPPPSAVISPRVTSFPLRSSILWAEWCLSCRLVYICMLCVTIDWMISFGDYWTGNNRVLSGSTVAEFIGAFQLFPFFHFFLFFAYERQIDNQRNLNSYCFFLFLFFSPSLFSANWILIHLRIWRIEWSMKPSRP